MKTYTLLLVLLLASVALFSQKNIPARFGANIKKEVDDFTGNATFTYVRPTYFFIESNKEGVELYLRIGIRRSGVEPHINRILIKVGDKITEIDRNESEFKVREIVSAKSTQEKNTKVVKHRNKETIFIDEFIGSFTNYRSLMLSMIKENAKIRIESSDLSDDFEVSKFETTGMLRLYELYEHFKQNP